MLSNTNSNVVLHVALNWFELVLIQLIITLYRVTIIAKMNLITLLKKDLYSYRNKFVDTFYFFYLIFK